MDACTFTAFVMKCCRLDLLDISLLVRCLFFKKMLTKERTREPLPYKVVTVPTLLVFTHGLSSL